MRTWERESRKRKKEVGGAGDDWGEGHRENLCAETGGPNSRQEQQSGKGEVLGECGSKFRAVTRESPLYPLSSPLSEGGIGRGVSGLPPGGTRPQRRGGRGRVSLKGQGGLQNTPGALHKGPGASPGPCSRPLQMPRARAVSLVPGSHPR